ncbi:MAG: glycosyltransferase family 2 protein [Chitinophagales bacterium]
MPIVSIVILNWNGRKFLEKFLPSVLLTKYSNLKIYVADNASTDDSIVFLEQKYPTIKIIRNNQNYGFATGYNQALKNIESDYYVLLNSDVEVSENWIEPIINLMEKEPQIAICQPKILAYHNKKKFEYAGAAGGFIDSFGYPFCRGRLFDVCETDSGQYDNVCPIFWASGAAMFVRANVYKQMGGLDDDFFAHMEEIDFCWRVQRAGFLLLYCPQSVVYHVGGGTLQKSNPYKTYLNFRNNLAMLYKNLKWYQMCIVFPIRLLLDMVAAFRFLWSKEKGLFKAILKAYFDFWSQISKWQKKRNETASNIKNKLKNNRDKSQNIKGRYKGSIVLAHFLRKKQYFSDL